ncbi:hypothetical protein ACQCVP_13480 [Rossellomorea vietnamensis]|uniref:hypothetical protein n=1 Tax=Rossellomorea vietnamensis TaxID=218284 RepID=UPI003CF79133
MRLQSYKETLIGTIGQECSLIYCNTLSYNINSGIFELFEPALIKIGSKFLHFEYIQESENEEHLLNVEVQETPYPLPHKKTEYGSIMFKKPISAIEVWSVISDVKLFSKGTTEAVSRVELVLKNAGSLILAPNEAINGCSIIFKK